MRILVLLFLIFSCSLCFAEGPEMLGKEPTMTGSTEFCITQSRSPNFIFINAGGGFVKIGFDGKVEIKDVTLDKAAQEFWKSVAAAFPSFREDILIEEREKQAIKKESNEYKTSTEAKPYRFNLDTGIYVDYRR